MKKMQCGNCGGINHELWQCEKKDAIIVKCRHCGNKSAIEIYEKPKLSIKWVKGQNGIITVF